VSKRDNGIPGKTFALIGTWDSDMEYSYGGYGSIQARLTISKDKFTRVSKCSASGKTVSATSSSALEINESAIEFKNSDRQVTEIYIPTGPVETMSCTSAVVKGTFTYKIDNDQLSLEDVGGQILSYHRVKE
jgi:hypothetical protein